MPFSIVFYLINNSSDFVPRRKTASTILTDAPTIFSRTFDCRRPRFPKVLAKTRMVFNEALIFFARCTIAVQIYSVSCGDHSVNSRFNFRRSLKICTPFLLIMELRRIFAVIGQVLLIRIPPTSLVWLPRPSAFCFAVRPVVA